jgi:aryl-alcohol dehydrogenase-like predicted oxidoreductase
VPAAEPESMKTVALGTQGLTVSQMGLGCMMIAGHYGTADADESTRVIDAAVDGGVTLFDTANVYGGAQNEVFVGQALAKVRDRVTIATKFGFKRPGGGGKGPGGGAAGVLGVDGSPAHVREACDASLGRLGIDTIDLYYLHRVDPKVPIEETVGAMGRLVEAGKVRHIGLCEAGARTVERAHATFPLAALQTEYSLWSRDVEAEILPTVRRLGIGFVAYAPLGRGFLTGALTSRTDLEPEDRRNAHPRFQPGNFEANQRLLLALDRMAAAHGCTKAQLALAWVLAQGNDIVPIPGTRQTRYLQQNAGALAVSLSPAELAILAQSFPPGAASGSRYPEAQLKTLGI